MPSVMMLHPKHSAPDSRKNGKYVSLACVNVRLIRTLITLPESRSGPPDLKKVLFSLLKWPILVPIIPRLALLAFTFCQPLLLRRLLDYLNHSDVEDKNIGYGLIGAYFVVYVGLAVSRMSNIVMCFAY